MSLPTVALSIRQPWASLIAGGRKDIENRSWPTRFRGLVLIHAGKTAEPEALADVLRGDHPVTGDGSLQGWPPDAEDWFALRDGAALGGIIGVAEVVDCVTASRSDWFVGPYGFVMANARRLPFTPCRGMLGFFRVSADVLRGLS